MLLQITQFKVFRERLYEALLHVLMTRKTEKDRMNRSEILSATESLLRTAGFQVSEKCVARPSCFCLAARKGAQITFVKVQPDLGNISRRDASELGTISALFSSSPLFISEKTREKPLEDDTVYTRYNICAVTPKTLEDVVCRNLPPLVEAGPGGCFARLNGEAVRMRRQKLGLSVGKLAEQLGVSRQTLYGYERGMAKASVSAAYNLEYVLGIPVVNPINLFQPYTLGSSFLASAKRAIIKNRFLKLVLKKLAQCHFNVSPTTRAPFDFVAQNQENQLNVIGGIVRKEERDMNLRAKEILSISEIVKAQPVLVTEGQFSPIQDIPLIGTDELAEMKTPEDLISIL
jgi:putative transcriptional regulator